MIKKALDHKILLSTVAATAFILIIIGVYQVRMLNKAHSTFNNYYVFRGCAKLLRRTSTYGVCKTNSGQTIKIVLHQGKWYLDGDLPNSWFGHLL